MVRPDSFVFVIVLAAMTFQVDAAEVRPSSDHWLGQHEKGWFWYHSEEDEEPEKKELPKQVKPEPKKEAVKEAKTEEKPKDPWQPVPRKEVIEPLKLFFNNPQKNAKNFLRFLERLSNRGMEMAAAIRKALDEDPSLYPISSPASTLASAWMRKIDKALRDKVLEKNKGRIGFVFFLRGDSPMSAIQASVANNLYRQGYQVLGITPNGEILPKAEFPIQADGGIAKIFGVKAVPSVYLVDMEKQKHIHLGNGVMALFDIQLAELDYLQSIGEWKPPTPIDAWDKNNPIYKGKFDRHFNPFMIYKMAKDENDAIVSQAMAVVSERKRRSLKNINR